MQLKRFLEFKKTDLDPVKSFKIQDELNPKIWDDMKMKKEVKEDLLKISKDFFDGTDLDAEVKDIILTGSLSNYNWSKYSDFDLHIIIDFKEINKDVDLVKQLVDGKKTIWNLEHDIKISGYDVEVYIQDEKEPHMSTGIYSIMNDKWNVKPKKIDFEPDEKEIEEKSLSIMKQVDKIEEDWKKLEYEEVKKRVKKVWDKVKKLRKDSLEKEGEFGLGNLVFKVLRRNNYIGKIMKIKKDAYVKQFESINEWSDNELLNFFYELDKISKELSDESDEGHSYHLDYEFDENAPGRFSKMEIDFGYSTYSDSRYNKLELDWSEVDNIKVKETGESSSPYGDHNWEKNKTFEDFNDVIKYIRGII